MPAKGHSDPTQLPALIRAWLQDHPGGHRTRDVAEGIGAPVGMPAKDWTMNVGRALSRLALTGDVEREYRDIGHKRPVGHYSTKD